MCVVSLLWEVDAWNIKAIFPSSFFLFFQPYFSGTRSLSPMSSLFGSIWTPQSEPYQSHFHPERSVPVSPHTPISPVAPFSRVPGGACPGKQYSSFNPFGPHINLDIWNSSSNRSSNSQLSNDSGYCGDMWANGAFVLNKEKQNVLLSLMGENVNILLSFMFDVVVRFSILLYIFLDVLQVWPLKIKKKKVLYLILCCEFL